MRVRRLKDKASKNTAFFFFINIYDDLIFRNIIIQNQYLIVHIYTVGIFAMSF